MTAKELKTELEKAQRENKTLKEQILSLKTDKTSLKCLVARLYQNHPVKREPNCYLNTQVKWWLN